MREVPSDAAVNAFLEDLITERGITGVLPGVRDEIKADLISRLDDFLTTRIASRLAGDDRAAFEAMVREGRTAADVQAFAAAKMPDYPSFLIDALAEFRATYLSEP